MANPVLNSFGGQYQQESIQFTLAAGTVTLQTKLHRWRPVGIVPYGASSIVAESLGVIGTPDSGGYFTGDIVIESSEGASTSTGFIKVEGF